MIANWFCDRFHSKRPEASGAKCQPKRHLFRPYPVTPIWPLSVSLEITFIITRTLSVFHVMSHLTVWLSVGTFFARIPLLARPLFNVQHWQV